ncbi:hypothetical protein [Halomonas sp. BM-2019]|uniref:hypothetical protein n=1 Tax=Halomonas sp. BM-2019 TaxID=2811227 RepID=UPI001B3C24FE|nr:MAG: hypothetical protein J5F18_10275 [Halomonas sp. BM-2019]
MQGVVLARPLPWLRVRLARWLRWLIGIIVSLVLVWTVLAIGYAPLPWPLTRLLIAVAFALFSFWALWRSRHGWSAVVLGVSLLVWFARCR